MQFGGKEIKTLTTLELVQAWNTCVASEQKRLEASRHPKFTQINKATKEKPMEFPPPNPNFAKLKNEIATELKSRNIKLEN